jgi:hypothetical protein
MSDSYLDACVSVAFITKKGNSYLIHDLQMGFSIFELFFLSLLIYRRIEECKFAGRARRSIISMLQDCVNKIQFPNKVGILVLGSALVPVSVPAPSHFSAGAKQRSYTSSRIIDN